MIKILLLIGSILSVAASCAPVYAGMSIAPGTPAHTHSDASTGGGTLAVSGTLSSTKACATGFTRLGPNYCSNSGNISAPAWTNAVACTARTTGASLPAGAKAVQLRITWVAKSNNAAGGTLQNYVNFYATSGCGFLSFYSQYQMREWVAVAAGAILGRSTDHLIVPLVATDTFYTVQSNAGGNGNAEILDYEVEGYFD